MKTLLPRFSSVLLVVCVFIASCKNKTLFQLRSSSHTGITFNNAIVENDSINPIDLTNIYNGGGVGVADFNNDGLQDLYFTGSLVPNQLYLNKGDFEFEDVTKTAAVEGKGNWSRGVAVVDINNDGWQDLYVCASMHKDPARRQNLLYVNSGAGKDGIPRFTEQAAQYGLNDTTHSTMAAFFDYDNDGDLDLYLVVNQLVAGDNPSTFRPRLLNGQHPSTGRLYRNDWSPALRHGVYHNVSREAGVTIEGYGHGVTVADINRDGWKDLFVSNDFNSVDLLYINNGNGTFTDKVTTYFRHTSANGMGQDIIDINNDGLSDLVEMDMNPEDNYRKKMMMMGNMYQTYQNSDNYGYQYQYVRNTLQLNQGPRVNGNDSVGDPVFSDIGFFAGIAETDWSWAPVVQDFDNDGLRDIIITNGYPKDVTDRDFIAFRKESFTVASKEFTLQQIPQVKLHNYAFQNTNGLSFGNVTQTWGLMQPTFSNGAVYADLDNDGDMDLVVNNINDEASVYENSRMNTGDAPHYLNVQLVGDTANRNGLGAWVELYYGAQQQVYEQTPYRGYLSSMQLNPHFGLGKVTRIDSLVVKWPNGRKQVLPNIAANQTLKVDIRNAGQPYQWAPPSLARDAYFTDITPQSAIPFQYKEKDFVDFNIQKLLPHKFSEYGPALAAGDINGDGLDDLICGGAADYSAVALLQQPNGSFQEQKVQPGADAYTKQSDDMGTTLFDADGDGDLDLYIARGGFENNTGAPVYADQFFVNNGRGGFTPDSAAIPMSFTSKSCVRPADYDRDGDLDLFVAGRVDPWNYPKAVSSFLYRNDSKGGVVRFTDVSDQVARPLRNLGMVSDAVWSDYDNDGWCDLVLAGEWMPLTFLKNNKGLLAQASANTGVEKMTGWWTSIVPGDFDNDGDMDYVAGNLGLNSFYRASPQYPVAIYAKDFDKNGSFDAIPAVYLPVSHQDTQRKVFAAHVRDDLAKQMISFRTKYQNYKSYAAATFNEMFTTEELKGALKLQATCFSNSLIRNDGGGRFSLVALPAVAQFACLNGMMAEDFDQDGNLDLVAVGNDYGTEPVVGRYDACNGLVLKGNGKGGFRPLSMLQSGWYVPGNAKALVKMRGSNGRCLLATSRNRDSLKIFAAKNPGTLVPVAPLDVSAVITYRNGMRQKKDCTYGSSFLSQSGRFLNIGSNVATVAITNSKGVTKLMKF